MSKPWFRGKKSTDQNKTFDEISIIDNLPDYGFRYFRAYFPDEIDNTDVEKTLLKHLQYLLTFIKNHLSLFSFEEITSRKKFTIDLKILLEDDQLLIDWPDFAKLVIYDCEYCMKCLGLAMNQFIVDQYLSEHETNADSCVEVPIIQARITTVEPLLQLKDLKVNYFNKLVTVKGTVIKAGQVKLVCQYLAFQCSSCGGTQMVKQTDGAYIPPRKCSTRGCHSQKHFIPLHTSPFNRIITWQSMKIQELIEIEQCEGARIPRSLDCELTEDLVKCCIPGDDVTVTGIVKVRDLNSNNGCNKQHTIFNLYLEAVSICNDKKQARRDASLDGMTFNVSDCHLIQEIHSRPNLFKFLVHSLCPSIYGHEVVKAGLLLSLFGGTKSETFRGESHVLIVGDPGLGKSQMLQACANVAPRGVYVCGNTSTSSGLTVTVTREGNEFAMEAGALMLADQGTCCIDEFDKMPSQHACLLEAMEQQSISVAKAGIVCNLPTRASILAAANPAGGHYNKAKTIAENLKISSPMLSRFDLIFILLDQPNEQMDLLLSRHVLSSHKINRIKSNIHGITFDGSDIEQGSLRERLRSTGDDMDHLPHPLFRKYIAYAQKYVKPYLSDGAKELIKEFYLSLRKQFKTGDCTPITTRQLNSLIRLTQARAKVELREEASRDDAKDVIELMKFSLVDVFTDSSGVLDKTRSQIGTGMSTKNQVMKLLTLIQIKSDAEARSVFKTSELKEFSEQLGMEKTKFYNALQTLNIQGFILNKGQNQYQLVTAVV